MAHKESVQNSEIVAALPGISSIYTVSSHVGYGYKNKKEDVRLVQFFINAIAKDSSNDWPGSPNKLVTDGQFGGKTWSAIKGFQKWAYATTDGMVTPVDGNKLCGSNQGKVFTMYYLNWYYWMSRPEFLSDLRNDPELPSELRVYLSGPLPDLL